MLHTTLHSTLSPNLDDPNNNVITYGSSTVSHEKFPGSMYMCMYIMSRDVRTGMYSTHGNSNLNVSYVFTSGACLLKNIPYTGTLKMS